jgi:hypothetical protein
MRRILTASLVLSSVLFPALASASTPAPEATAAQPIRVSTGVTSPSLLTPITLDVPSTYSWQTLPGNATVGVSLVVDEKGNAHNVQVTRSLTPFWDARIADAISKAHYRPASLDEQSIPMTLNLTVAIAR